MMRPARSKRQVASGLKLDPEGRLALAVADLRAQVSDLTKSRIEGVVIGPLKLSPVEGVTKFTAKLKRHSFFDGKEFRQADGLAWLPRSIEIEDPGRVPRTQGYSSRRGGDTSISFH